MSSLNLRVIRVLDCNQVYYRGKESLEDCLPITLTLNTGALFPSLPGAKNESGLSDTYQTAFVWVEMHKSVDVFSATNSFYTSSVLFSFDSILVVLLFPFLFSEDT